MQSNNRRIAKNTFYLYIRLGITLIVQFYTSRVVLNVLGVDDFGLWSVIASFIVTFSFISGPLSTATQRFLNYEIGSKGGNLNGIFSTSILIFLSIGAVLFVILEIAGVWFVNTKLNISPDKLEIAHWTFQFAILAFIVNLIRMPYESAIIAEERMSFYAVFCIVEAVLLLGIVYILLLPQQIDKLVMYGALTFLSKSIITLGYKIYCNKRINYTKFKFAYDKRTMKELASFSGWNLFGALASATSIQGINILLNMFFGVAVNAAYGIASQVVAAVMSFISNFLKAVKPQIVKSYASSEMNYMHSLICAASKYSFFLLFALAFPIMLNMDWALRLWLGDSVPPLTAIFCNLTLVYMLIVCLSEPMDTAVLATGSIKRYQIVLSSLLFLNILISYLLFKIGWASVTALVVKCMVEIIILFTRLWFVHKKVGLPVQIYWIKTIIPILLVALLMIIMMFAVEKFFSFAVGWLGVVEQCMIFYAGYIVCVWFFGLRNTERKLVTLFVINKIVKRSARL